MTTRSEAGHQRGEGSDPDFAVLLREGRGFDRCYDTFAPRLYRYCWSLVEPARGTEGTKSTATDSGAAEEPAAAAVRQTFLAAAELIGELGDRTLFRPWLFSLARAASQQQGFATRSPFVDLATVPAERPAVEVARRLPPSHRELLELHLRHALPVSEIAKVLSLDTDIAGELCRAAVRRAADILSEFAKAPGSVVDMVLSADAMATGSTDTPAANLSDASRGRSAQSGGDRPAWTPSDVARLLAVLEPPGPPADLREEIVEACVGDEGVESRRHAAAELRPLTTEGFPQHRERTESKAASNAKAPSPGASGATDTSDPADTSESSRKRRPTGASSGSRGAAHRTTARRRNRSEKRGDPTRKGASPGKTTKPGAPRDTARGSAQRREPRKLPRDRITTNDVDRISATEPIARPTRPPRKNDGRSPGDRKDTKKPGAKRRRWPASAISGLVTVAASVLLSASAVFMTGDPGDTITDPGPPGLPSPPPLSDELATEDGTGEGGGVGGSGGGRAAGPAPGGSGGTAPRTNPGAPAAGAGGTDAAGQPEKGAQRGDTRATPDPTVSPSVSASPSPPDKETPPKKDGGGGGKGGSGDDGSGGAGSPMARFFDDLKNFLG
ncbi:hypothetical protein CDO52_22760 [Nocardiopsis gilva YIM 90087]|uniref:Uncharacterized protein n=1 Tax=Nocardiopsis gilva YIM 90087 TaxID=1235441 RepID=A0A223SAW6_9ACTN|nr:hypothetical protein [Nocardiopsis gilva]ASU85235.1 hypothetical protein CDO52_22760 [Nocardiopsis gilva YIM 90087]